MTPERIAELRKLWSDANGGATGSWYASANIRIRAAIPEMLDEIERLSKTAAWPATERAAEYHDDRDDMRDAGRPTR